MDTKFACCQITNASPAPIYTMLLSQIPVSTSQKWGSFHPLRLSETCQHRAFQPSKSIEWNRQNKPAPTDTSAIPVSSARGSPPAPRDRTGHHKAAERRMYAVTGWPPPSVHLFLMYKCTLFGHWLPFVRYLLVILQLVWQPKRTVGREMKSNTGHSYENPQLQFERREWIYSRQFHQQLTSY